MATRVPTEFLIRRDTTTETIREAVTRELAPPPVVDKTVYVRLEEEAARAKVTREGFQFPALTPEDTRIKDYIDRLPRLQPHVLSQNPKPGTKVPRGSTIEITMGYGGDLPVGSFVGSHIDLGLVRVDDLYDRFLTDQTIRVAVSRDPDVRNWRPDERAALTQRLEQQQVPVDEADTARNSQAVVNSLIVANTYGYKG